MAKSKSYSVLIRHPGWLDRFVRYQPRERLPVDDFNAWVAHDWDLVCRFATPKEAQALADQLAERFGKRNANHQRYEFIVVEERLIPRWFILNPDRDADKRPIRDHSANTVRASMPFFQKRPIVVEAYQWFLEMGDTTPGVFAEFISEPDRDVVYYVVTIHRQRAYLDSGNWIITESDKEHHYPCTADEFERIYQPL